MNGWLENHYKRITFPPPWRLCHNEGNAMFVILNPSPCVTLTLSEAKGKGLAFWLRVNSVKDLMSSFALLRTCFG